MLLNPCPTHRSVSPNDPAKSPATYAVLTKCRALALTFDAKSRIFLLPSTFFLIVISADEPPKLVQAAQRSISKLMPLSFAKSSWDNPRSADSISPLKIFNLSAARLSRLSLCHKRNALCSLSSHPSLSFGLERQYKE